MVLIAPVGYVQIVALPEYGPALRMVHYCLLFGYYLVDGGFDFTLAFLLLLLLSLLTGGWVLGFREGKQETILLLVILVLVEDILPPRAGRVCTEYPVLRCFGQYNSVIHSIARTMELTRLVVVFGGPEHQLEIQ